MFAVFKRRWRQTRILIVFAQRSCLVMKLCKYELADGALGSKRQQRLFALRVAGARDAPLHPALLLSISKLPWSTRRNAGPQFTLAQFTSIRPPAVCD